MRSMARRRGPWRPRRPWHLSRLDRGSAGARPNSGDGMELQSKYALRASMFGTNVRILDPASFSATWYRRGQGIAQNSPLSQVPRRAALASPSARRSPRHLRLFSRYLPAAPKTGSLSSTHPATASEQRSASLFPSAEGRGGALLIPPLAG